LLGRDTGFTVRAPVKTSVTQVPIAVSSCGNRALLVPGGRGLHKRYCAKLRTGRRIRKSRWLTRSGHGAAVRNMKMIDQRPPEVETKQQVGHWEGDLIVGVKSPPR
jgi:IS30 family transposase